MVCLGVELSPNEIISCINPVKPKLVAILGTSIYQAFPVRWLEVGGLVIGKLLLLRVQLMLKEGTDVLSMPPVTLS